MKALCAACTGALLLAAQSAAAHHSYAMFDREKKVALVGTVKEFKWSNPHAWMEVYVPNDKGGSDMWGVEMNSPNNLARMGWKSTIVKPGDKVTVVIHPLRSGEKGGSFLSLTLPNGQTLSDSPRTQRSAKGPDSEKSPY
ncbi:MAG TPA: DUF6152 family protein [Steroidobacteraceae bacterium]|nr:DUF6152 family protein [Steroidobacteraceae bacterium]